MFACSSNDKTEPLQDWHASALNPSCLGTVVSHDMRPTKENELRDQTRLPESQRKVKNDPIQRT
jgi:hypothetical protein